MFVEERFQRTSQAVEAVLGSEVSHLERGRFACHGLPRPDTSVTAPGRPTKATGLLRRPGVARSRPRAVARAPAPGKGLWSRRWLSADLAGQVAHLDFFNIREGSMSLVSCLVG